MKKAKQNNKTLKLLGKISVVVIILLLSLISFAGIYVKDKNAMKNVIPEYKLGTDLYGARNILVKVDDSTTTKKYDSNGNLVENSSDKDENNENITEVEEKVKQGIIGAILLKWIKNGYITVLKMEKGILSFKDNNYAIDLTKITNVDNEIENGLLKILITAAGPNKILEAKEFKKWSKKNYSEVSSWFSSIDDQVELNLEKEGLITLTQETTQGMFGTSKNITIKNVNPKLKEEAIQLKGLKKFLLDFSIMPEREYFEVKTWEEYLIFAQLMGIADKVAEQFSKIYPNFNQESLLNSDFTTLAVINMADFGYAGMVRGYEIANSRSSEDHDYSGSSRSSGSGGSSYSSGGSSAEGSSGGGFR